MILYLWIHVIYYLVDRGSMIGRLVMMVSKILTLHVPKPSHGEENNLITRFEVEKALTECGEGFAIVVR